MNCNYIMPNQRLRRDFKEDQSMKNMSPHIGFASLCPLCNDAEASVSACDTSLDDCLEVWRRANEYSMMR